MKEKSSVRLGVRVRALRRRENLTQKQLAERLGISVSYLNLIENNRRPMSAELLIKLAKLFNLDIQSLAMDDNARLISDLIEVFSDPIFEDQRLTTSDIREIVTVSPSISAAIKILYRSYQGTRESAQTLAARLSDSDDYSGMDRSTLPSEEVSDMFQQHMNYFPTLEEGAERIWQEAKLDRHNLYLGLMNYLKEAFGVKVETRSSRKTGEFLRRYDPETRTLTLSETIPPRSQIFHLAHQLSFLSQGETLEFLTHDANLTTDQSRKLTKLALANYFAGAIIMPYERFYKIARESRYDIEYLARQFYTGFEQVCQRLTSLRRPGMEALPFYFIRVDIAGNISKKFSGSGIRFARFSGGCAKWNVFSALLTPGHIQTQVSRMPNGSTYFSVARTIHKSSGVYSPHQAMQAIDLGCEISYAREMIYSDGVDLDNPDAAVPIGVTCRLCERMDCSERAFPSILSPHVIDENVRGASIFGLEKKGN